MWVRKTWLGSWAVLRMPSLFKTCLGLKDLLPRWHTRIVGNMVLVVDGRPQFLCIWASPQHCLGVLTWWLVSLRAVYPREQSKNYNALCDLAWKSYTVNSPPHVGPTDCPHSVWEETTKRHKYQKERITGAHLGDWLPFCSSPCICGGLKNGSQKIADSNSWNLCHLIWKRDLCGCD